jgi:hypothetical protein
MRYSTITSLAWRDSHCLECAFQPRRTWSTWSFEGISDVPRGARATLSMVDRYGFAAGIDTLFLLCARLGLSMQGSHDLSKSWGRSRMNARFMVAILAACQILISTSPLLAQHYFPPSLTNAEKRVYHACLYAHWIDNYCRVHAWGFNNQSFRDCVVANGACDCVVANGGYWGADIDEACLAQYPAHRL